MDKLLDSTLDRYPDEQRDPASVLNFERTDKGRADLVTVPGRRPGGLLKFFGELHRRRVCRAATMYAVALWLILQIIQLIEAPLQLPVWTLKLVIVMGLLGFPIAVVISWLFDATPSGLVADAGAASCRSDGVPTNGHMERAVDLCLIAAALVIALQLAFGVFSAPANAAGSGGSVPRIVVMPLRIASENDADRFAAGLLAELHHELMHAGRFVVAAPARNKPPRQGLRLMGAVFADGEQVQVTIMLIDNATETVTWTETFRRERTGQYATSSALAEAIVVALPGNTAHSSADTEA